MTENFDTPSNLSDQLSESVKHVDAGVISFDQLTQRDKWRFFWGYVWRSIVVALISSLAGAVVGGFIGLIIGGIGAALEKPQAQVLLAVEIIGAILGGLIGLFACWQLIRWLFRARWFGYRLRLVRDAT